MPPRRKKKRVKRRLRWGPLLGLFLVINVAAGSVMSRTTRITHVRVEGVPDYDQARVREILGHVQDQPILSVRFRQIEWEVLQLPEVRYASISANPFGFATLKVGYRTPVARLEGTRNAVLDADGILFVLPKSAIPDRLPVLQLDGTVPPTLLTVAGDWPSADLAKLAVDVRALRRNGSVGIQVDERGAVCLNMGAGRVVLGSLDDLDKKLEVLRQQLATEPEKIDQGTVLNLTQPDRPTTVVQKPSAASTRRAP